MPSISNVCQEELDVFLDSTILPVRIWKRRVSIHIGGIHASGKPTVIETLLGSCVAVCLYDPVESIGGMNHIFLPGRADMRHFDATARFGINAMELLINRLMRLGASRERFVAKAFGGAHMMLEVSKENGIGAKNAEFVLDFLEMESIPLVNHNLGGYDARRIYFHTDTGEVFLKRITPARYQRIELQEQEILKRARKEAKQSGGVTLFS